MPPKKKTRAERPPTAAQLKRAKEKEEEEATLDAARKEAIQNDPLVLRHSDKTPALTVTDIFEKVIQRKEFEHSSVGRRSFDWSVLKAEIAKRNADSPTWFMHIRSEDLVLEPNGMEGAKVEVAVIAETREATLAPMHMVTREPRPYSDLEDNMPEKVRNIADQGFCWREVRADDGAVLNIYLLQQRSPTRSFSFGAAVGGSKPASSKKDDDADDIDAVAKKPSGFGAAAGFGGRTTTSASSAPATAAGNYGFGKAPSKAMAASEALSRASEVAPNKPASFGFGAAKTPQAAAGTFEGRTVTPKPDAAEPPKIGGLGRSSTPPNPFSAGFGSPSPAKKEGDAAPNPPPPTAPPATAPGSPAGFGKNRRVNLEDVLFTLWTADRLKDMKSQIHQGSRIVIEDFPLPAPVNRKIKIQMQNDRKGSVEKTVEEIVSKLFAKENKDMKTLDAWIDDCPIYDSKFQDELMKMRTRNLKEAKQDDKARYDGIHAAVAKLLTDKFEACVADRLKILEEEEDTVEHILQLVTKKRILAPKDQFRVLKYYPKNDLLKFRPFGKVSGVHDVGESADVCVPPAYVPPPLHLKRLSAP